MKATYLRKPCLVLRVENGQALILFENVKQPEWKNAELIKIRKEATVSDNNC